MKKILLLFLFVFFIFLSTFSTQNIINPEIQLKLLKSIFNDEKFITLYSAMIKTEFKWIGSIFFTGGGDSNNHAYLEMWIVMHKDYLFKEKENIRITILGNYNKKDWKVEITNIHIESME